MAEAFAQVQAGRERQRMRNEAVHSWYQFVLAYPDHLVTEMLPRFGVGPGSVVLDPFCGTGTTLVECKKLGIASVGIDANPAAVLASRVKTDWDVDSGQVEQLCSHIVAAVTPVSEHFLLSETPLFGRNGDLAALRADILKHSAEGQYLVGCGMLDRHWIDEAPFYISLALLSQIEALHAAPEYVRLLKLALASCMVETVANVRFGPEIYVVRGSGRHDVVGAFAAKVASMVNDLRIVKTLRRPGAAAVFEGDSRECDRIIGDAGIDHVDYVITSPPYPTEKDYTRNTRLELIYLGFVRDRDSLRRIKGQMVRSHSKGIYKGDSDGRLVAHIPEVKAIADELREKVRGKTYGFAKQYPRIIEEYFGGMYRHFLALSRIMRARGKAAYVVGEQRTYLQTFTPTGTVLARLAERPEVGFRVDDIFVWRIRQGTTGSGNAIKEEIVVLEKR